MAEPMIKVNKPFYFKPCGPPRPIWGLLRLKSVPVLAVKRRLEQAKRLGYDPIGENHIRIESNGGYYFIEGGSEVDGDVSDVITSVNLGGRWDGTYQSAAFDPATHDEHWTRCAVVGAAGRILHSAAKLTYSGDDGVGP